MNRFETIDNSGSVENPIHLEIEKKWLIDISKLPMSLDSYPNKRLVAGYFEGENHEKIRIRQEGDKYFKVIKGPRTNEGMVRDIGLGDIEIIKEEFEGLWPRTEGKRLSKTRYFIPVNGFTAELDVYDDFKNTGFYTIEVEFTSIDDGKKFVPPDWFGREVTNESGYSSRELASHGLPESF
jgi:CYTH domain-containing protein